MNFFRLANIKANVVRSLDVRTTYDGYEIIGEKLLTLEIILSIFHFKMS